MPNRPLFTTAAAVGLLVAASVGSAQAQYPERPITLIVPWAAGGGTDATGRIIGSLLEDELGQPVNVVNRTGGSGVVGHSAIANAEADGYTIGVATVEIGMMHWQGLTELTWEDYTPIALYNADPAGLQVNADSEWETAQDVLDAVRESETGDYTASGTGQGGIWHLALAGMLNDAGIEPDKVAWVPSQGAAPALQDLAAGGIDIVTSSVVEAAGLLDAGEVRSLAVMWDERLAAFPDVPTLKEETGLDWTNAAWRGIVGPKGMPEGITETLRDAMETVYNSDEFNEFMANQGFGLVWARGEDFADHMAESNQALGDVMKAVGIAQ